jgi:hypothetical protein
MGYLHQIYARLPRAKPYYEAYPGRKLNNTPGTLPVIGVHAQYLGEKPKPVLKLLLNTLLYHTRTHPDLNAFLQQDGREMEKLLEIYSKGGEEEDVNWMAEELAKAMGPGQIELAPYFTLIGAMGECYNPILADTEMGITVMGLSTPTPKYCLMFGNDLRKPLDAASYAKEHLEAMYPPEEGDDEDVYSRIGESERKELLEVVAALEKFEVLTVMECREIFPGLYGSVVKRNRTGARTEASLAVQRYVTGPLGEDSTSCAEMLDMLIFDLEGAADAAYAK